jgi:hypothetical protein
VNRGVQCPTRILIVCPMMQRLVGVRPARSRFPGARCDSWPSRSPLSARGLAGVRPSQGVRAEGGAGNGSIDYASNAQISVDLPLVLCTVKMPSASTVKTTRPT